jgi:hypothetical protein
VLEALGLVELHPAVLLAPAVVGLLGDRQVLADLGQRGALGRLDLGLAELGDDRLGRVTLTLPLR